MVQLFAALLLSQNLAVYGGEYFVGGTMVPNRCIRVSGKTIRSIGVDPLPDDTIIDARGRWIIPGLIDSHAHATFIADDAGVDPKLLLPMYRKAGVTTLRDLGGDPMRTAAVARAAPGPTIFPGSWFLESYGITHPGPWSRLVRTEEEIAEAISDAKKSGAVTVKIYGQLHPVLAQHLVSEAKRAGILTACHPAGYAPFALPVDSIEHSSSILENCLPPNVAFTFATLARIDLEGREVTAAIQAIKRNGTAVCPTLLAIGPGWRLMDDEGLREVPELADMPAKLRSYWERTRQRQSLQPGDRVYRQQFWKKCQALTLELYRDGVPLIVGSDSPCAFLPPGSTMHREMEMLVRVGIPPAEVLNGATVNGAKILRQDSLGVIAVGKVADLVILNGDPLADISNTRKINAVIYHGRVLPK
jgi:Amidohydrolase family